MKKYVLLTVTILALAAAGQASAQTAPTASAPGAAMTAAPGGEMTFAQHKAKVLENLQKRMACVQASQNRDQLHACFPPAREGMMGGPGSGMAPGGAPPQH